MAININSPKVGWNGIDDLSKQRERARGATKPPCRVSVAVPGAHWLPESVILGQPVVSVDTFLQFVEMDAFLGALMPELSERQRHRAAMFSVCHLAPWSIQFSPCQVYGLLANQHPAVFEQIDAVFTTAFGDEEQQIGALVRQYASLPQKNQIGATKQ